MDSQWDDMIASGEITPACTDVDLRDIEPVPGGFDLSGALKELREHER